eukprot:CFRG6463T1
MSLLVEMKGVRVFTMSHREVEEGRVFFQKRFESKGNAMDALWAELPPSKEVNPEVWEQMITFWKENIQLSAEFGRESRFVVNIDLLQELTWNNVTWDKADLGRVMMEMLQDDNRETKLMHVSDLSWNAGLTAYMGSMMKWIIRSIIGVSPEAVADTTNQYVLLGSLQAAAFDLLQRRKDTEDGTLCTLEELLQEETIEKEHDVRLILMALTLSGQCTTRSWEEHTIIKFSEDSNNYNPVITEKDISLVKLRQTIKELDKKINSYNSRIAHELEMAKRLKTSNKKQAIKHLRNKKQTEDYMVKVWEVRFNLERMLHEIENSSLNVSVMQAMQSGAETHKELQKDVREQMDEIMDDVQDTMDQHEDISDALTVDVGPMGQVTDAELDELDHLEKEHAKRRERTEMRSVSADQDEIYYPVVPVTIPTRTKVDREMESAATEILS